MAISKESSNPAVMRRRTRLGGLNGLDQFLTGSNNDGRKADPSGFTKTRLCHPNPPNLDTEEQIAQFIKDRDQQVLRINY
jgi:hypothetical protein